MKKVLIAFLVPLCFLGTLLGLVAATGNLSKLPTLFSKSQPEEYAPATPKDLDVAPLLRAIKDREDELDRREAEIKKDEVRVKALQRDLEVTRENLLKVRAEIDEALKAADAEREERRQYVALTLAKMDAKKASEALKLFDVTEAAAVLVLIKEKDRASIIDEMEPQTAAKVFEEIQRKKL